jgi:hypothetical protein
MLMSNDVLTVTQEDLVGEIYDIAAKWRDDPALTSFQAEVRRYHAVKDALKVRFGLEMAIKADSPSNNYRAGLAIS